MRLVDIRLTRFGAFEERSLTFGAEPGLVVVYGANEAGKSTTLAAIGDFLFGVPERTAHGGIFGGDAIRISATVQPQTGDAISLVRRKGRSRTLMDSAGSPADEALLTRLLGGTTRSRFETLFGLDHHRLRSGGDSLLSVEGDIGRLIVEAGGGLRTLMERLTRLDHEIDQLFDTRRSSSRLFYQVLDDFEAAASAAKAGAVSLEAFERQQAEVVRAQNTLEDLTGERTELAAEANRLERLVRVAPILRSLDQVRRQLSELDALPILPSDYDSQATGAMADLRTAKLRLIELQAARDVLKTRLHGLPEDLGLCPKETEIRDAAELATHVTKAREDRPAREAELAASQAQLSGLRQRLSLSEQDDLTTRLPGNEAVARVQGLASEAERRSSQLENGASRVRELQAQVDVLADELLQSREKGWDTAAGVSVADIASLPAAFMGFQQRKRNGDDDRARAHARAERLGYEGIGALASAAYPTLEDLTGEITARERMVSERTRLLGGLKDAEATLGSTEATLESLMSGPEIASDDALNRARQMRSEALAPLREAHLLGRCDAGPEQRVEQVAALDSAILAADEISDRHAAEAQRAAVLAQAIRAQRTAEATVKATEKALQQLADDLKAREGAWLEAFADAAARFPQLAGLRAAVDERGAVLKLAADADTLARTLQVDEEALHAQVARLELAERLIGGTGEGTIAERANRAIAAVNAHEQGHETYRRVRAEHQKASQTLEEATRQLAALQKDDAAWRDAWSPALEDIGLSAKTSIEEARAAALEWASAGGVLTTLETTKRRLDGMDRDEVTLKSRLVALAEALPLPLPADPVAAAKMLDARLTDALQVQRRCEELQADLQAAELLVDQAETAQAAALDSLTHLCTDAGLTTFEEAALSGKVEAHLSRRKLYQQQQTLLSSLATAGDGVSEALLRQDWQDRDVDRLKAEQEAAKEGAARADAERIAAAEIYVSAKSILSTYQNQDHAMASEAAREAATAELHDVIERYVELSLARDLIKDAVETVRKQQQDPMIARAGGIFATLTRGAFKSIAAEVDAKGQPAVVGERANEGVVAVKEMSDGTRDQLYLAFRLAGLEQYARVAEPLPFVADDILVHFDDDRSSATLEVLAEFAKTAQVLLFTHHVSVKQAAEALPTSANVRILSLA